MTQPHPHRTHWGILAGSMFLFVGVLNGVPAAHAAVNCVTSFGVTQTETTVTGTSANDTIDCGGANPGKTINGGTGNDTITGTASSTTSREKAATTRSPAASAMTS